ncbi:hypothetical protein ABIA85_009114 [Bradyrhizobium sp. LA6.10]
MMLLRTTRFPRLVFWDETLLMRPNCPGMTRHSSFFRPDRFEVAQPLRTGARTRSGDGEHLVLRHVDQEPGTMPHFGKV